MPRRSLRPPLKPVKIPLNLILFTGFNRGWRGIPRRSIMAKVQAFIVFSTNSGLPRWQASIFLTDEWDELCLNYFIIGDKNVIA